MRNKHHLSKVVFSQLLLLFLLLFSFSGFAADTGLAPTAITINKITGTVSPCPNSSDAAVNAAAAVTVFLKHSPLGEKLAETTATLVSGELGTFSFLNIANGDYVVEISRPGYLTRYVSVTVAGGTADMGAKPLLAGDVNGDGSVDDSDADALNASWYTAFGDDGYNVNADFNADGVIADDDYGTLNSNYGKTILDYQENVTINRITGQVTPFVSDHTSDLFDLAAVNVNLKAAVLGDILAHKIVKPLTNQTNCLFNFFNIANGDYILELTRPGYLTRYVSITVSNGTTDIGSKTLMAGDVNGDGKIDGQDADALNASWYTVLGDDSYNVNADFNADGAIEDTDYGILNSNDGKTILDYQENVTINVISGNVVPAPSHSIDSLNQEAAITVNIKNGVYGDTLGSINAKTGSYQFINKAPGNYVLEISRPGYLTRYTEITAVDGLLTVPQKELFGGDFNNDGLINQRDLDELQALISSGDLSYYDSGSGYQVKYDLDDDETIGSSDINILTARISQGSVSVADYNESVALNIISGTASPCYAISNSTLDGQAAIQVKLKTAVLGEVLAQTTAVHTTEDKASFSFFHKPAGTYILEISRPGFLTRYTEIIVTDGTTSIPEKNLYGGDFNGDGIINQTDLNEIGAVTEFGDIYYEEDDGSLNASYQVKYDLNGDGYIDGIDIGICSVNLGKDLTSYEDDATYQISGTVGPVAYIEDDGTDDIVTAFNEALAITVNLKDAPRGNVVSSYSAINAQGNYIFTSVSPGTYYLEIKRAGYLTRYAKITVSANDVTVSNKHLICGDINGDLKINQADDDLLRAIYMLPDNDFGGTNYDSRCDLDGDGAITAMDIACLLTNLNQDITYYDENIDIFSVSGIIEPSAYIEDDGSFGDIDIEASNIVYAITVNLRDSLFGNILSSQLVLNTEGSYSLTPVLPGEYFLEFSRSGFLTRYTKITIADSNVIVPSKTLICGDVNGNLIIDDTDINRVIEVFRLPNNSYGEVNFDINCDMNGDGEINALDVSLAVANKNKDVTYYNEGIEFFGISGIIMPSTYIEDDGSYGDFDLDAWNRDYAVTVNLRDALFGNIISSQKVLNAEGSYSLTPVLPGEYFLEFSRPGFLTRYTKVTVNDSSVVIPEKTLICGDVNGDFKIDASDVNRITEVFALTDNEYGGENFDICCDMDGDGIISPDDIDLANMNRGKDATFYNEGIEFFF